MSNFRSMEERNADVVRKLWTASSRGGTEAALALLDDDAEWRLHIAPDRVLTTRDLARMLMRLERHRHVSTAHLSRFAAEGEFVFASGSFRWSADDGSISDFHGYWLYELRDGTIVRGQSYASRQEGMRAFDEAVSARSF